MQKSGGLSLTALGIAPKKKMKKGLTKGTSKLA